MLEALLSIVTGRLGVVVWFPATSVTTTWSSAAPSGQPVVFSVDAYGDVESLPNVTKVAEPNGRTRNWTLATPEVASVALAETVTLAEMVAFAAGAVIEAVGAVLSTTFDGRSESCWFPAWSDTV